jgi:hypothetical protein
MDFSPHQEIFIINISKLMINHAKIAGNCGVLGSLPGIFRGVMKNDG